jgi:type II secretory pathway pseudopilin PulG
VLRKNLVVLMMVICTLSFVVFTMTNFNAFAQNNCSAQDNAACAQSDLSLPVPSENDIVPPGVQQQPPDHSQDDEEDSGGQDDNGNNDDGNTFLLPFP